MSGMHLARLRTMHPPWGQTTFAAFALLVSLAACSADEKADSTPSAQCVACSGAHYKCHPPQYESFDIVFEPGGDTECSGTSNATHLSTPVRLKCDFSELCKDGSCLPAKKTAEGFLYGATGDAVVCAKY